MNKSKITTLIGKYNLGGLVESVKIEVEDGTVNFGFVPVTESNVGYIKMDGFDEFPDGQICIYNTAAFLKILNAMDEDVKLKFDKNSEGDFTKIQLKDKSKIFKYALADKSAIKDAPSLNSLPDFETKVKIDKKFIDTFMKSYGALVSSNATVFSLTTKGGKLYITINYNKHNESVNTAMFPIDSVENGIEEGEHIVFDADFFKSVIVANKEIEDVMLEVSSENLAKVTFKKEGYKGEYYLIGLEQ